VRPEYVTGTRHNFDFFIQPKKKPLAAQRNVIGFQKRAEEGFNALTETSLRWANLSQIEFGSLARKLLIGIENTIAVR
jgi:hypothetical protein